MAAPLAWAEDPAPEEAPCPGYTTIDGMGRVCPQPDGTYVVMSPDGRPLGPVSHTDPVPPGPEPDLMLAMGASDVECVTSSAQYAIWVIYARASNDVDNYNAKLNQIRYMTAQSQQHVSNAAAASGGTSKLKVLCDADGKVTVKNEALPTSMAAADFDTIVNDLYNKGYSDGKKKYWVFYDDTGACGCSGTGHWYSDSTDAATNMNNGNYVDPFFAVTFGYNSTRTWLHELGHNLGAVQNGAPSNSGTNYAHCVDGLDIMCYDDGGPNTGSCIDFYCSGTCSPEVWDCKRNTYYNLTPAATAWLGTHWNIGETYVRYLTNVVGQPPTMTSLNCTPTSISLGESVTCDFTATDTVDNVAYDVAWGDGATERVPATGYVASGTTRTASRTYATDGVFTVSVTATDDASAPLTSAPLTRAITVQASPAMVSLSCSPSPAQPSINVTCSFRANDGSTGVFYEVDWGDGSPLTRVPSSGHVAPNQVRTATHVWSATGSYTVGVRATDNGSPPLSSSVLTTPLDVDPNVAPVMASLSCSPNPVQGENPTTCTFSADDALTQLYYTVDWGDGSPPLRVPASGAVDPGVAQQAARTYTAAAERTVSVTATDMGTPSLTSPSLTTTVTVTPPNVAPVMAFASCNLVGASTPTTCTFRATDGDSSGVRYRIEWGDATTSTHPSSGFVSPNGNYSVGHTYARAGLYLLNVTATDNGSPQRTSAALQITVNVSADAAGPVLSVQAPFPKTLYVGCTFDRDLFTGDAVYLMRGCVRATASDPSGVASVTVLVDDVLVATDAAAPYVLEFDVPEPGIDRQVSVVAYDTLGNSRRIDLYVDMV